ncbi:hypothetical protein DQ239_18115 [Blastococcus sp. TF02-09]|uniref:LPXTG cell wall anchor domain-containing protein n=1 Tax=Blastococcus sp. TF02-09 TaxID=2250576 RepID=UPI000DEB7F50|nr:LPXTG cell wall anchor domain-containing protein [Blastococcus sp. TF02-9]RBY74942.1 hypothetical protein DQ239_18115 [Blastococcus sp. TF02-9]
MTYVADPTVATTYRLAPGGAGADAAAGGLTGGAGGTNALDPSYDGADGDAAGGGGGASSVVTGPGDFLLSVYGGNGGGDLAGPGSGDGINQYPADGELSVDGEDADGGAGAISAEGIVCAPATPSLDWVQGGDRTLTLHLSEGWGGGVPTTGYQYTLDGGTTWTTLTTALRDDSLIGTLTGLTNGTSYTVAVRAVAANGTPSDASEPQTATAHRPIGAPGDVAVTHTPSGGLHITWSASPADGTFPIAGYGVGWDGGQMGGPLCSTEADVLSCDVAASDVPTSGLYWVTVQAADSAGNPGIASERVSANGVPSAVPTKTGDLVRPAGESGPVTSGSAVRITGSGYAPHSTVTLIVYSVPRVLATTVADGDGDIDVTVTLPEDLAAGEHTLVAAGVGADGQAHYLTLPITVSAAPAEAELASTGADVAWPALGGLVALAAGGGLLVAARRRPQA